MPEMINPNASIEREMQQRNANLQFAGQLMLQLCQGQVEMTTHIKPAGLFDFAIGVAEQMNSYFKRPFDEPSRLVG